MQAFAGFHRAAVGSVPVLWRHDARFKTFRLALLLRRPLDGRAAARALLPDLLLQGTARDPSRSALMRRMESLYGGFAVPAVSKHGETHVLQATADSVAGQFLPDGPDQMRACLALLADILHRPRLDGAGFPADVFAREQKNQANAVRAEFDDKATYARRQALALACEGEPMAIPEHGGLPAILVLKREDPERARQDFLVRGQALLMAMGALPDDLLDTVAGWLADLPAPAPEPVPDAVVVPPRPRRATLERADIQQSKLVMVFRFPPASRTAWPARRLFANLLGGGPHARLFKEVREKRSLAYSIAAGVDHHKGLLTIAAGLDETAADTVEALVHAEIANLQAGRFAATELQTAKAGIVSGLTAVDDSIAARLTFTFERWLEGVDREPAAQAQVYAEVAAPAVAAAGAGLWLDHVYLLAPASTKETS
ncbi:MAG: insulinase family protein [Planctomycetota bacterium]